MEILSWAGPDKLWPVVRTKEGCFLLNLADPEWFSKREDLEVELSQAQFFKQVRSGKELRTYYRSNRLFIVINQTPCFWGIRTIHALAFPLRLIIGLNTDCRDCLRCAEPGEPCGLSRQKRFFPQIIRHGWGIG